MTNDKAYKRILKRLETQYEKEEKLKEQLKEVRATIRDLETEKDAVKGRMIVERLQSSDISSIEELNEFLDEVNLNQTRNQDDNQLNNEGDEY